MGDNLPTFRQALPLACAGWSMVLKQLVSTNNAKRKTVEAGAGSVTDLFSAFILIAFFIRVSVKRNLPVFHYLHFNVYNCSHTV
ncbi:MAG: hypothetical protein H7Y86_00855 [Rhizobacter sp.]|nr:hypothetical protein [Ferruginibacter sp.]